MSTAQDVCKEPGWVACQTLASRELYGLMRMASRKDTVVLVEAAGATFRIDRRGCQYVPPDSPLRGATLLLKRRCRRE